MLAAAGSHLVDALDDPAGYRSWQSALLIHVFHAVVLLVLSALNRILVSKWLWWAVIVIALGLVFFSGSVYVSHLFGIAEATKLAPAGGLLLMLGWLLIIWQALKGKEP